MKRTEQQQMIYDTIQQIVEDVWYNHRSADPVKEQTDAIYEILIPMIQDKDEKKTFFEEMSGPVLLGVLVGSVIGLILGFVMITQPI